jgi:hypothetical protein
MGNPKLREDVEGMNPSQDLHETYFHINPVSVNISGKPVIYTIEWLVIIPVYLCFFRKLALLPKYR